MLLVTTMTAALQAVAPAPAATDPAVLAGRWEGSLNVGGQSLPLVLRVEPGADGALAAVIDSPAQGAVGIPVAELGLSGDTVRFSVPSIAGRFEGARSADGETVTGAWSQGPQSQGPQNQAGASLPLILTRAAGAEAAAAPERPQNPQPPFPYDIAEVALDAGPGVRLAGTLTTPPGAGPHPAVVLITGSGPQDRDETVFGHKPFWVLADALARRGVAALRLDDRGVGGSTGPDDATSADFADDIAAAVAWLALQPGVDAARIGLIGHSEGGLIAPLTAAAEPRVAFVVTLAGPAVPGGQALVDQERRILEVTGAPEAQAETAVALQTRIMAAVTENADDGPAAAAAVEALMREAGTPEAEISRSAALMATAWARWLIAHDPADSLRDLKAPLLAIYGGKDVQVPPEPNVEALARLAPSAEVRVLPDLNHLLQTAGTGLPDEYAGITETMAPEALDLILGWIAARTGLD